MINTKICEWLIENGDVTTRYRVFNELLCCENEAIIIEKELAENDTVKYWLKALKPETPPQHWSMHHGSFDFNLENALLKVTQLGLHAGFDQVRDAVGFYLDYIKNNAGKDVPYRNKKSGFNIILMADLLINAGFKDDIILDFMLKSLDELHSFVAQKNYELYISDEERSRLKGVPKNWVNSKFIKKELWDNYGFCYPLIYDMIGMHKLYELKNPETDNKVDEIISYISNDEFHSKIGDGYGILIAGERKYYGMGWDPKYPGWYHVQEYMETGNVQKLLFFAQTISKYPVARKTKWFHEVLDYLERYKTDNDIYMFPAKWFKESQGYAVGGHHISFGENRRKKNRIEIESTLYMQFLKQNI